MATKRKSTAGIVIHRAETWTGSDYHCVILRDGKVMHMVLDDYAGHHALKYNPTTIGIAVQGYFATAVKAKYSHPTQVQLRTLVNLCIDYRFRYGNLWIKGHTELGPDGTTFPEKLTAAHACPGSHLDLDALRQAVADSEKAGQCLQEPFNATSKTDSVGNFKA